MAIPIPAIIALAQFAPTLFRFLGVGQNSMPDKVAESVASVARTVSGASDLTEAIEMFAQDSTKAMEFRIKIQEQEQVLAQMYLADMHSARERDIVFTKMGIKNTRANFMFVLAVAIIGWLFYVVWQDPHINEFVKGIVTLVLGRFLGYLDTIYSFEFGTTRSSKEKDSIINKLSGD